MSRMGWLLVDCVAQCLDAEEREAVLGDLAEAGETAWQSLSNLLGLVARRQLSLWKSWRPWLAAFALALPCTLLLMGLSVSVSLSVQRLLNSTTVQPGPTAALLLGDILLLLGWAWTCGFVMASVSRRTVWVSVAIAVVPCIFCLARFRIESLSPLSLFLFVAPALWGLRRGLRVTPIKLTAAIGLVIVLAALTIPTWSAKGPWTQNRFLVWPAGYMILQAVREIGLKRQPDGE